MFKFVLSLYDLIESLAAAAVGAALEAFKLFSCRVNVAVDLPAADELEAGGAVFDEAAHVLGRIAEKQADLVGKIGVVSEPAYEAAQAAFGAAAFAVAAGPPIASSPVSASITSAFRFFIIKILSKKIKPKITKFLHLI